MDQIKTKREERYRLNQSTDAAVSNIFTLIKERSSMEEQYKAEKLENLKREIEAVKKKEVSIKQLKDHFTIYESHRILETRRMEEFMSSRNAAAREISQKHKPYYPSSARKF